MTRGRLVNRPYVQSEGRGYRCAWASSEVELLAAIGIDYFAGELYGEPLTIGVLRGDDESDGEVAADE